MKPQPLHSAEGDDSPRPLQTRLSDVGRVGAGPIPLIHQDVVEGLLATMRQPMYPHRLHSSDRMGNLHAWQHHCQKNRMAWHVSILKHLLLIL